MTTPSNLEIRFSYFCEGCDICAPTIDEYEFNLDFYGRRVYTVRCEHATACALMESRFTEDQYTDDEPLMEHEVYLGKEE